MRPDGVRRSLLASLTASGAIGTLTALGGRAAWAAADARIAGALLPDAAGQPRALFDGRAAATLLDFWASWCAPCRQSFPWMNDLHDRHSTRGLRIVAVNVDAQRADAERFLARYPARFDVLYDPAAELPKRLAIKGMPSSLLLDAAGRVRWTHTGFRPSEAPALESRILQALPTS
jgi:cytochrome c biogenesis protein CcmG, thiol:disulfide interchange protein DsbE